MFYFVSLDFTIFKIKKKERKLGDENTVATETELGPCGDAAGPHTLYAEAHMPRASSRALTPAADPMWAAKAIRPHQHVGPQQQQPQPCYLNWFQMFTINTGEGTEFYFKNVKTCSSSFSKMVIFDTH